MSAEKCGSCGQTLKPSAIAKRAARSSHNSDFDTGACKRCGEPVVVGWTEGLLVTLDGRPVNEIGEMAAVALGLSTYIRHGARFRLRDTIGRRTFPDRPQTVHAAHSCGQQWPPALLAPLAGHETSQPNSDLPTTPDRPNF